MQPTVVSAASLPVSFIEGPVLLESSRWLAELISTSPYIIKITQSRKGSKMRENENWEKLEGRKEILNSTSVDSQRTIEVALRARV